MNYLSIYNRIIDRAISQKRRKHKLDSNVYVYYEKHHIIPKCIGGTDTKDNLVLLTAREHFVAHQLLVKIYPGEHKLVFALRRMCSNKNHKHKRNNREYEWIKQLHAEKMSLMQKGKPGKGHKFTKGHTLSAGKNNGMYNKTHSQETKDAISMIAKARGSVHLKNVPKSELHKENISKSKRKQKYKLVSPSGTEFIFDRAKDASDFSGLSIAVIIKLAGSRYSFNNCRGWQCISMPYCP